MNWKFPTNEWTGIVSKFSYLIVAIIIKKVHLISWYAFSKLVDKIFCLLGSRVDGSPWLWNLRFYKLFRAWKVIVLLLNCFTWIQSKKNHAQIDLWVRVFWMIHYFHSLVQFGGKFEKGRYGANKPNRVDWST